MYYLTPETPGVAIIDYAESPLAAYRFAHAVELVNRTSEEPVAAYDVYAQRENAQPPIDANVVLEDGEIYTRLIYLGGKATFEACMDEALRLSYVEAPRQAV